MMLNQLVGHYQEAYDTVDQRIKATGTVVSETSDACLKDPNLNAFFGAINEETLVPTNNWKKFTSAVAQNIDTTAIDTFATVTGEKLDYLIKKAKEYSAAMIEATKAQS